MKKILLFLLLISLSISLVGCNSSKVEIIEKNENTTEGEYTGKTIILHTNDMHGGYLIEEGASEGGLEGYAAISSIKKDFEAKGATVILADGGDFSQGSIYVSLNKGVAASTLMDEVGYDVVTIGNHEFDYGFEQLKRNIENKNYKVVCSNVFENDKLIADSEVIIKVGKLKIGFFGLLTPEAQTGTIPNNVKNCRFTEKQDLYDIAQKEIDLLKKESDIVICLSHLGVAESCLGNRSVDVYANTNGIDFIIDGHSHNVMEAGEAGEPIQSAGTKGTYAGVIIIDNETKAIESNYLIETKDIEADNDVLDLVMETMSEIDEKYGSIFANSDVDLDGIKEHVRCEETNLGDLISDAIKWHAIENGYVDMDASHVVSIMNGGGIRANINKGGVSMKDVTTVMPFGNTISVDYVSGSELLEALEASTFAVPAIIGGFPHVSGMEITVDATKPYDAGNEYPESTYQKPNSISRVTINSINGNPFDENEMYAVVASNFIAQGGDTYYVFKAATDEGRCFDSSIGLDEATIEYIDKALEGKITEEYLESQGRIIIKQ